MDLIVDSRNFACIGARRFRCVLGRGGVRADKREGDGATPIGVFALRRLFFRADRLPPPPGGLPAEPIADNLGWCDDPAHRDYNRLVTLPFAAGHERLWRDDALYDLICVIGHNDAPVIPGNGSAIFLHIAREDFAPTEGCVAFGRDDLMAILALLDPASRVRIMAPGR